MFGVDVLERVVVSVWSGRRNEVCFVVLIVWCEYGWRSGDVISFIRRVFMFCIYGDDKGCFGSSYVGMFEGSGDVIGVGLDRGNGSGNGKFGGGDGGGGGGGDGDLEEE